MSNLKYFFNRKQMRVAATFSTFLFYNSIQFQFIFQSKKKTKKKPQNQKTIIIILIIKIIITIIMKDLNHYFV